MEFVEPTQTAYDEVTIETISGVTYGQEQQNAMNMLEIHAIYNRHVTTKDALQTLEKIPADSIVYLEGLRLETLSDDSCTQLAITLGQYARDYGKDEEYYNVRNAIIQEFKQSDKSYENTIYSGLLEKDCQIIHADYGHATIPEFQEEIDTVTAFIDQWYQDERRVGRGRQVRNSGESYLAYLRSLIQRRWQSVEVREESAVEVIAQDAAELLQMQHAAPRSDSGKIKTFLVYGASHQHSLTRRLEQSGAVVVTHDISRAQGGMYIHESQSQFQDNFLRVLGFTAFMATTRRVADIPSRTEKGDKAPISEVHESLARLNGDEPLALDFCTRCLKVQKLVKNHPKKALKNYWELVNDYR